MVEPLAVPVSFSGSAELPHLGTFAKAAELGSFTAAAAELGITQAAVSQRIAALEKELRVSLFDRGAGRMSLTDGGRRLYEFARKILDLHEEARKNLGGLHPPIAGDLPIAASSVPGECFLPALLPAFQEKYPQVHVRATVSDSSSVLKDIEKGRATVGLVGQKTENPGLEFRAIASDRLVLIVPSAHPSVDRKSISLKALKGERLIVREAGSGSRCVLERGLEQAGTSLAALNVALELGSNAAIKDAVRRGLGVAFLSRLAARRELDSGELKMVAVKGLDLPRDFYVVFDQRRPLPHAARAFLHYLALKPMLPAEG
jgi:LysR family transcriptional regulator, low CO2-responsive transcriptional regulator